MPKYALAISDSLTNEIAIHFLEGESEVKVAQTFLLNDQGPDWDDVLQMTSMEEIKRAAFDADSLIEVKEIPNA